MANGNKHDHPISDIVIHGMHPFPKGLEELVVQLHKLNPGIFNDLEYAPFDWEKGKYIKEAKVLLQELIDNHGNPKLTNELVNDYKRKHKNG